MMDLEDWAGVERRYGVSPDAFAKEMATKHGIREGMTFPRLVARAAEQFPAKVAIVHHGRILTYAQVIRKVQAVRAWLTNEKGVKAGERVALLVDNSDHYPIWYLGILAAGAVAVPINPKLVPRELAYMIGDAEPVLMVQESRFDKLIDDAFAVAGHELPRFVVDRDPPPPYAGEWQHTTKTGLHAPAAIYYTSGTTGSPKGVIHTHFSLMAGAFLSPEAWEHSGPSSRFLAFTPMFHIASHVFFLVILTLGATLIVDSYQTERTMRQIADHRIDAFFAVPSQLLMMEQHPLRSELDFSHVRVVTFGAAPMAIERLQAVQNMFPNAGLVHCMGQTESCGMIVALSSKEAFKKIGSVGLALPGNEIRVVDAEDNDVPQGEVGELVSRGPQNMTGYLNRPEATEETLRGGWLHTGDLGYLDKDGYLFLVDRSKDMIIRGGENIYSTEVEDVVYMMDGVSLCAVIGVPDKLFGEEVGVFIVAKAGASITAEDVQKHCRENLASYKVPRIVEFVEEFAMTATGKIQKGEIRKLLADREA
ncbi:MAG: class I adenylate-forming enzyme family protein [Minwuia sp.]|uniref:class I adenylate-forming enzyme family protein n=1 Tax=Minwuia sp. TaxID=2493630 RepID=UPI003A8A0E3D